MELTFEYWYLFPISVLVATIAMTSGVGGAVFFSPIFSAALRQWRPGWPGSRGV